MIVELSRLGNMGERQRHAFAVKFCVVLNYSSRSGTNYCYLGRRGVGCIWHQRDFSDFLSAISTLAENRARVKCRNTISNLSLSSALSFIAGGITSIFHC